MTQIINSKSTPLSRNEVGKNLIIEILQKTNKPIRRREIQSFIKQRITQINSNSLRTWLKDLKEGGKIANPSNGFWSLADNNSSKKPYTAKNLEPIVLNILTNIGKKRSDIQRDAQNAYLEAGGFINEKTDQLNPIKKALGELRKKGLAVLKDGEWFSAKAFDEGFSDDQTNQPQNSPSIQNTIPIQTLAPALTKNSTKDHKCIGTGKESVYVYYYKSEKENASHIQKKSTWPIKIGKTTCNVQNRINQQAKAGRSEPAVIALEINTDDCNLLERLIHDILKFCGLHINAPGREWFDATPQLVESIYHHINAISALHRNT